MVEEVVNGPLAGGSVLGNEAQEGEHRQTSILNLLEFELIERTSNAILGELKGVESTTGISRHSGALEPSLKAEERSGIALASGLLDVFKTLELNKVEGEELDRDEGGVGDASLLEGDLAGLEPFGNASASLVQDGGAEHASNTQHGPTAVIEFGISVPVEGLGVLAEAEGVEPKVTC